jgi:transcriptional regulator with XRE-family HTH domain
MATTQDSARSTVPVVKGVNLVAENGLGDWLRKRRNRLGLTHREVAAAASLGARTVQRYEADDGIGYETLRLLDALSVRFRPALPTRSARALNTEVRDLADRLAALEGQVAECVSLVREALELLREADAPAHEAPRAQHST